MRFPGHGRHNTWDGTFDTAVQLSGIAGRPALSITPDSITGIWSDAFKVSNGLYCLLLDCMLHQHSLYIFQRSSTHQMINLAACAMHQNSLC